MKALDRQRKLTLMALSAALVVAVYLNWQYSRTDTDSHLLTQETNGQTNAEVSQDVSAQEGGDLLTTNQNDEVKNYGDAQLVATTAKSSENYFEETRLSRQKSRDDALDVLQKSLKNSKLSDSEKTQATEKLSKIIQDITTETDIENLVKAKGFTDCVAFINEDKITVAVQTSGGELTKQNAAQIRDIVLNKTNINSQNIVVIEVK